MVNSIKVRKIKNNNCNIGYLTLVIACIGNNLNSKIIYTYNNWQIEFIVRQ